MDNLGVKLNLTQEQKDKFKAMRESSRNQIKPLLDELNAERKKFRDLRQSNAKPEELQAQRQKMIEIKTKIREIHKQNLTYFEQNLTPEQKVKFQEIKKQRMERMKQKFEHRKNYGGFNKQFQ